MGSIGEKRIGKGEAIPRELSPPYLHEFDELPNSRKTSVILQSWMSVMMKRLPALMNRRCVTKPEMCLLSRSVSGTVLKKIYLSCVYQILFHEIR